MSNPSNQRPEDEQEEEAKYNLRLPKDLYRAARKRAAARGQTLKAWLCGIVADALEHPSTAGFRRM